MRAKKAATLITFLAPSAAFSFCILPHRSAQHAQQQQRCTRSIFSGRPPQGCTYSSAINPRRGGRGRARLSGSRPCCSQHVVMAATAGKPDTAAAAATAGEAAAAAAAAAAGSSSIRRNPRQRVSRALNRALGNILATGDMFGSVGNGVSDGNSFGGHFTSAVGQADKDDGSSDEEEEDIEGEGGHADTEDLPGNGLSPRKFRQEERWCSRLLLGKSSSSSSSSSANRLLRAKTGASAAVVVDGPFSDLQAYMTLPVSEYSLLDSSIIRRVSDTSFRFQIPLKDFVGLDFTPTMEVEVELDRPAGAVVFRSTRSTLYGNVGKPGEEASTNPWPDAGSSQVEYFRVGFDARLGWVDGDASLTPRRQRGRGGFAGTFARRPRPEAEPALPPSTAAAGPGEGADGGGEATGGVGDVRGDGGVVVPPAVAAGEAEASAVEPPTDGELAADVEPATVFCDTEIKVQVLLPPPYNTLLPWRLVRALLGKLLSTTVAFILPRFLELLADDFYGWQSGTRRAAATAGETGRTLLGGTGGGGSGGGSGAGRTFPAVGQQAGTRGSADAPGQQRANEGARWCGDGGGSNENANSSNIRNPVVGGLQRLRNVRGPGGDRGRGRRRQTPGTAAAAVVGEDAASAAPASSAATMRPPTAAASADGAPCPGEEGFPVESVVSSTTGLSGDEFNFEVGVQEEEAGGREGERRDRQQGRRRGWRAGRDRDVGGGGGGGSINWWG
ncbi:unnamed protein product [Ectocarpus sp. CCAP 1310/34]|nr:unnamed protein product [Ectocarpus sp. CCAP 1310/34]